MAIAHSPSHVTSTSCTNSAPSLRVVCIAVPRAAASQMALPEGPVVGGAVDASPVGVASDPESDGVVESPDVAVEHALSNVKAATAPSNIARMKVECRREGLWSMPWEAGRMTGSGGA